jgi:hypothetical protein
MAKRYYRRLALVFSTAVVAIAVVIAAGLYCTRYVSRDRGLRLTNFRTGKFTFDAWSYGHWETSKEGTLTIETMAAPYTLLLAIRLEDPKSARIEILNAALLDRNGDRTSILSKISDRIDEVKTRPSAAISEPHAVFLFNELRNSPDAITLEVEFRVSREQSVETMTQQLTIPGYEVERRSFTFWETMMSA